MKQKPKARLQGSQKKTAKPKAGLSFSEKKRLKELQRTLAGNHKEQEKPTTAQNTITFKKMFRDGICQVTSDFYTKMVEFYDINYDLLEIEDQGEILEEYSKLINYFDPSIRFELFLFNRQVNEQTLIDQFDIPLQGDDFDDIREEYTEMFKKQAAKGNNGIIKSKYLIFGTECKGYKEAKSKLNNIEKDVIRNFLNLGTQAKSLDGKERLRILHEYFNQDTMEPFRFSFKELAESGKSVKDYIAPPGFDFRYPSRFKAGKMYGSRFRVLLISMAFCHVHFLLTRLPLHVPDRLPQASFLFISFFIIILFRYIISSALWNTSVKLLSLSASYTATPQATDTGNSGYSFILCIFMSCPNCSTRLSYSSKSFVSRIATNSSPPMRKTGLCLKV